MGDIKYQEEGDEYSSPKTLAFRGPPYGLVTDFIIGRGWAKTRRQAEIVLLYISATCIAIVLGLIWLNNNADSAATSTMTPEEAAEIEMKLR